MPVLESKIDTGANSYLKNRTEMLAQIERFRAIEQKVRDLSNSKKQKFEKRGQLLPR